jgi:hypothetical protein
MRASTSITTVICLLAVVALVSSCGQSDPKAKLLEERARWDVRILSWAQEKGGAINVATRVSGPPNSKLAHLTVRTILLDAAETEIGEHWHTFDLQQVPRGGPTDFDILIPDPGMVVEGLGLSQALEPTPEQERRIRELQTDG